MIFQRGRTIEDVTKGELKRNNNTHFMLVDGVSKLMNKQVKTCQSSGFQVSGIDWYFFVRSDLVRDYISLTLRIRDGQSPGPNWEVKCNLKLSIVSQYGLDIIPQKRELKEVQKFVSYATLKEKYIVNDKVVFGVEIMDVHTNLSSTRIPRNMGIAECIKLIEVPRNNSRFTWKITQFSSFNGKDHSSYEFTVGPRRWILTMYPKGDVAGDGHLSLFLTATGYVTSSDPKGTTLAVFKLRVLDQLKRNHHETRHEDWFHYDLDPVKTSSGMSKFLPLEELHNASRGLLLKDEIYLTVEFLFVSTTQYL